jgi:hypothetical protein
LIRQAIAPIHPPVKRARGIVPAALIGALIGASFFLVFAALNYLSLGRDLPAARQAVIAAFDAGQLGHQDSLRGNTGIGQHQFNDCLILAMALDQDAAAGRLAVSPIRPLYARTGGPCSDLERYARGRMPDGRLYFYHNYIHGQTMLTRLLLPAIGVKGMRSLYHLLGTLVLLGGLLAAMLALVRGRRSGLFWLIAFIGFARFFGLEAFGQSLGHGPSDLAILGFALVLAVAGLAGGASPRLLVPLAAAFGALTIIFELLTGGAPLGLALLIGGTAFAMREGDDILPCVLAAVAAYCAAIVACIACKGAFVAYQFGPGDLRIPVLELGVRTGVLIVPGIDPALNPVAFVGRMVEGLDSLIPGMRWLALGILVLAAGFGAWGFGRLRRTPERIKAVLIAASCLPIFLWFPIFRQHTMMHAWFMDRILVWIAISGFSLFALAISQGRSLDRSDPGGSTDLACGTP